MLPTQNYLDKIEPMEREQYDPYIQRGNRAGGPLEGQFGNMASDPTGHLNHLMQGYQPSQQFHYLHDKLGGAINETAAAGGIAGTPQHQRQIGELTNALLSQDMQQWLNNVMGIEKTGLGGQQHLYDVGFEGVRGLTGDLSNVYGTQANLAQHQQDEEAQRNQDLLGMLGQLGGAAGGFALGGPQGAMIGSKVGSIL